jgi:hypothetical protein
LLHLHLLLHLLLLLLLLLLLNDKSGTCGPCGSHGPPRRRCGLREHHLGSVRVHDLHRSRGRIVVLGAAAGADRHCSAELARVVADLDGGRGASVRCETRAGKGILA